MKGGKRMDEGKKNMRTFGYVRVSTVEQRTDRQYSALEKFGVDRENIFEDKWTGVNFDRPAYNELLNVLKAGDLLVIKSLDRLGRNYKEMLKAWRYLKEDKSVDIYIIDMPILDTRTSNGLTGELISGIILQLLSYVAETERDFILQRQKEGIAEAKKKGIKFGRPAYEVPKEFFHLKSKYEDKKISSREAGKALNISHTTFIRWVEKY